MFLKVLVARWGAKIVMLKLLLAALDLEVTMRCNQTLFPWEICPRIMLLNLLLLEEVIRRDHRINYQYMRRHSYIQLRQCLSQSCIHHLPDLLWKGSLNVIQILFMFQQIFFWGKRRRGAWGWMNLASKVVPLCPVLWWSHTYLLRILS